MSERRIPQPRIAQPRTPSDRIGDRRRGPRALALAAAAALVLGVAGVPLSAPPAWAAAAVTVTTSQGGSTADPDFATPVTVSGSGFQTIQGGFGGIYVLFGWVSGPGWQPSRGGVVGSDYRYVPDTESKDNAGFQRFLAFPGSDTEAAANGVLSATGGWSIDMVIPGAEFQSQDRTGAISSVDCREVTCGIITIGAHGVKNPTNETFTPIEFAAPEAAAGAAVAPAAGTARVGYTTTSAVAGNALSFTGQGFSPGEQVVATLDDGVAAVGPLTAGPSGEVAGVVQLPAELRAGTHLLSLVGAASGSTAETEVTVAADPEHVATAAAAPAPLVWPYLLLGIAILIALGLLVASVATSIVRARRARRARRDALAVAPGSGEPSSTDPVAADEVAARPGAVADTATERLELPAGAGR